MSNDNLKEQREAIVSLCMLHPHVMTEHLGLRQVDLRENVEARLRDLFAPRGEAANFFRNAADELRRATSKHGPQRSLHEGYAVLLEEVDELWDEVKKQSSVRSIDNVMLELIQIAAMAARTYLDVVQPMQRKETFQR